MQNIANITHTCTVLYYTCNWRGLVISVTINVVERLDGTHVQGMIERLAGTDGAVAPARLCVP